MNKHEWKPKVNKAVILRAVNELKDAYCGKKKMHSLQFGRFGTVPVTVSDQDIV